MIIVGGRRSGKTYKLIKWVRKGNKVTYWPYWDRVIVCMNESEAERLRGDFDLDYRQVFSVTDWRNRHVDIRNIPKVAIDNADLILASYIGSHDISTFSDEVEVLHGGDQDT